VTTLVIDSSISGGDSVTRRLTGAIAAQLGNGEIIHRDLAAHPLGDLKARGQDPHILDEFIAAEAVVIGAPMYNFSIPSQLKAWLDRLAVGGRSFRYSEAGPEGLLSGKRVIIALASGGQYPVDSAFEHHRSYLRDFFAFLGIEPEFVEATGVAVAADAAIASASLEIERLAA
jgi:FMN-dependent NADH-azoreductase